MCDFIIRLVFGSETDDFSVWINLFEINSHLFAVNVVGIRDHDSLMVPLSERDDVPRCRAVLSARWPDIQDAKSAIVEFAIDLHNTCIGIESARNTRMASWALCRFPENTRNGRIACGSGERVLNCNPIAEHHTQEQERLVTMGADQRIPAHV